MESERVFIKFGKDWLDFENIAKECSVHIPEHNYCPSCRDSSQIMASKVGVDLYLT